MSRRCCGRSWLLSRAGTVGRHHLARVSVSVSAGVRVSVSAGVRVRVRVRAGVRVRVTFDRRNPHGNGIDRQRDQPGYRTRQTPFDHHRRRLESVDDDVCWSCTRWSCT